MERKGLRRTVGIALGMLVLGGGLFFFLRSSGKGQDDSPAEAPAKLSDRGGASDGGEGVSGKTVRSSQESNYELQVRLTKLSYAVIDKLRVDEGSRAKLIRKVESADKKEFFFEVARHPDIDGLLNRLCDETATEGDVDRLALRTQVLKRFGEFSIPEGHTRRVWIKVPEDDTRPVEFSSMNNPEGESLDATVTHSMGTMTSGKEKGRRERWTYGKILPLPLSKDGR